MLKTLDSFWTTILAGGISTVVYLLGGIDKLIIAFAIFMIIDYTTGLLKAFVTKKLNSTRGWIGVAKKVGMIFFVIIAVQLDYITGTPTPIMRTTILFFLIGVEGISILENLAALGLPIPRFLIQTLERFRDDNSGGSVKENDKNGNQKSTEV